MLAGSQRTYAETRRGEGWTEKAVRQDGRVSLKARRWQRDGQQGNETGSPDATPYPSGKHLDNQIYNRLACFRAQDHGHQDGIMPATFRNAADNPRQGPQRHVEPIPLS